MQPLPIDPFLPDMLAKLSEHRCLVVVAEPGAGKTTRVPPAIVQQKLLKGPNDRLIMLQPRRVAARAAAARIAFENAWELGEQVGYQVRGERRIGRNTRLQILTEGILTHKLISDPFLEGVGCVVLDEFHERHLDSDLCIAMLREVRDSVRDDLQLVVMSATLDAETVSAFLGSCPVVQVPGRLFPVETRFAAPPSASRLALPQHVAAQVRACLSDPAVRDAGEGSILVFLPGIEEIRRTAEALGEIPDAQVLPLHGSLPFDAQARVLEPSSQRKVILATNIAETSLTIDGVTTVIDAGLARVPVYDPQRGMDRLELRRISRASAVQRAGRAGRTAPGRCIRLWSAAEDRNLDDFEAPEVQRVDLASAILQIHQWGKADPRQFGWFAAPPEHTIASAEHLLSMLGALSSPANGTITPLGEQMLQIPAHPRLARLIIAGRETGFVREAATIAALLSEKDILRTVEGNRSRSSVGRSDLLFRIQLLEAAERSGFSRTAQDQVDSAAARQAARTRDELLRGSRVTSISAPDDELLKLVLLAYPDRVCRRRDNNPDTATMVGGFGVKIDPTSTVVHAPLFVAIDARDDTRTNTRSNARQAIARIISEVQEAWLEELFPNMLSQKSEVDVAPSGKVVARVVTCFDDLPIREQVDSSASHAEIVDALAPVARREAPRIFRADKLASQVLERVSFLRKHVPELEWPEFSDAQLGEILATTCPGKRSIQQVSQQDLAELLLGAMDWKLRRALNELAPESVTVPSGSRIRLEYSADRQPTLSVRLQEVFGWLQTPRIAGGKVPLVMELLGPNFRPVQITSDLASFWKTTYFDVRKDLRVRYPKHSWPEDPLGAKPEAKGRPRRT